MGLLSGAVAIVTGSGRGIGREIVLEFGREGADVIVVSRTLEEIARVSEIIQAMNVRSMAIQADISLEGDVLRVFSETVKQFGTLDILVNNAGIHLKKAVTETTVDEWDKVMRVNARGTFLCCREALRLMIPKNRGKIINISSESGKKGFPLECAYDSSKFAQIGLTQSLSNEVKDYNININAILPSATNTRLFRESYPEVDYSMILQPSDVSKVAVFLVGEGADKIKGACIELYNAQNFEPII